MAVEAKDNLSVSSIFYPNPNQRPCAHRVATSGTLNGSSIQSLSFIPQFPILASSCVLKLSPSLFLHSLSSLIPHYRLMKIRELIENSRPTIFTCCSYAVKYKYASTTTVQLPLESFTNSFI